jgi:transcriptional regulator with XRE-family HTH domain
VVHCDVHLLLGDIMNITEIIITLVTLRESRQCSPEEVASAIGVSPSSVYRWEKFDCTPNMGNVARYAQHLGYKLTFVTLDNEDLVDLSPQVGTNFYHLRASRGLSIAEAAARAGIARETAVKIEREPTNNNLRNVLSLARVLGYGITLVKEAQE